jgi:hypothetical protein
MSQSARKTALSDAGAYTDIVTRQQWHLLPALESYGFTASIYPRCIGAFKSDILNLIGFRAGACEHSRSFWGIADTSE